MKCNNCGGINPDDAKYCSFCGKKLEKENVTAENLFEESVSKAKTEEIPDKKESSVVAKTQASYGYPFDESATAVSVSDKKISPFDEEQQPKAAAHKSFVDWPFDEAESGAEETNYQKTKSAVFDEAEKSKNESNNDSTVDQNDVKKGKYVAWLSYFGILFFIPWIAYPKNDFCVFHAKQGLVLFVAEFIINFTLSIIELCFKGVAVVTTIIKIIMTTFSLVFFIFLVLGVINVVEGEKRPLPLIGRIAL